MPAIVRHNSYSLDYGIIPYTVSGTLTVQTGAVRLYFGQNATIRRINAGVGTAPTGTSLIIDVNKNGTTLFSTQGNRPTIAVSTFSDTENLPDVVSVSAGDYLTVDIDQIGSTIAGENLTVTIEYTVSAKDFT